MATITGSEVLAQSLRSQGTDTLFYLMGGPMLETEAACIALGIRAIDTRHEQAAALAAHAWTRVTRRPGEVLAIGPHSILDLGDDAYTRGRPHPLITRARAEESATRIRRWETPFRLSGRSRTRSSPSLSRRQRHLLGEGSSVVRNSACAGVSRAGSRSKGTPSRSREASRRSGSVFERIARRQPRFRSAKRTCKRWHQDRFLRILRLMESSRLRRNIVALNARFSIGSVPCRR